MRFTPYLALALPALASAQEQVPLVDRLKGYFDQAQEFVNNFASQAAHAAPDAGAAKVAEHYVHPLTFENWKNVLQYTGAQGTSSPEPWLVYITGGNKTCAGRCADADRSWNEAVALLARESDAPKLASVDCESTEMLCGAWGCRVPSIWHILVPKPGPDQSQPPTLITEHPLNATTVTNKDITQIHTRKLYLSQPPYQGALHPFDGWIAKAGLTVPMAYTLFYLGKVPSWAMMLGISFFSRTFMSRRMNPQQQQQRRA